jgi:peptidyl-tRNA hydrolase
MSLKVYPQKKKVKTFNQAREKAKTWELIERLIQKEIRTELEPQKYSWSIDKTN